MQLWRILSIKYSPNPNSNPEKKAFYHTFHKTAKLARNKETWRQLSVVHSRLPPWCSDCEEDAVQVKLIRNGLSLSRRQSGLQCDRQQMKTDEL